MAEDPVSRFGLGVLLLGAGASSRMGQPKLLLPWGSTSILGHLLKQWEKLGARQIAVACAASDERMRRELDRLAVPVEERILNPTPERGMFSSIQCAAQWNGWHADLTHWVIVLGDQPHLPLPLLRRVCDWSAQNATMISQPSHCGRPRHPVVVPGIIFRELALTPAANLKEFLKAKAGQVALREMDDPALDVDLDTPADYERARREFLED
jgi:molybdenum cofactor cytidylyltransferase